MIIDGLIYGLFDPRNGQLRYVGKTRKTLASRLAGHRAAATKGRDYKSVWFRALQKVGVEPEIRILEEVDHDSVDEAEVRLIAHFKALGCELTNLTAGGEGRKGPCTWGSKIGAANLGKKRSAKMRARLSAAHAGLPSPNRGREWSDEYKETMVRASGGRPIVDSNGNLYPSVNEAARQLGLNPGHISNVLHGRTKTARSLTFRYAEKGQ